jgi:hypothetical protein
VSSGGKTRWVTGRRRRAGAGSSSCATIGGSGLIACGGRQTFGIGAVAQPPTAAATHATANNAWQRISPHRLFFASICTIERLRSWGFEVPVKFRAAVTRMRQLSCHPRTHWPQYDLRRACDRASLGTRALPGVFKIHPGDGLPWGRGTGASRSVGVGSIWGTDRAVCTRRGTVYISMR